MTVTTPRILRSASLAAGLAMLLAGPVSSGDDVPRGFTADQAAGQRDWEARWRAIPKAENQREYMRVISEEPHHAGSPGSKAVADYILAKFREWGLNAWIEEHEALMPTPEERLLELVEPEPYQAELKEPALPQDKDSTDVGQLPTFNAYAADGDVTAQLVYVNYGTPEDFARLESLGVSVKDKIVIARYGRSWRGIKPKLASERGALGCLIYSDPADDGYVNGTIYPEGPYRPWQGVQRGSVMDMPLHPGDPLTPGWGAVPGGRRLDLSQARTLLKIPVLPISYGDALPLLRNLRGVQAPEDWRGALPITYHVGPGPAKVHLKTRFDWKVRPLYNVLARIEGAVFPDEWVIHGNHHDAWVNGAEDPTSGNVALMETARAFGELLKQGFKPKRTLVFASWDGEEWGLLGSTEWAEKHAAELRQKAVAYLNTDSTGKGWLSAEGSHSLQKLVSEVAREVFDPKTGQTIFEAARERRIEQAKTEEEKSKAAPLTVIPLGALGSGSDYTAFLDHLTIASLNLSFGGAGGGGIYHSIYDSFDWFTRFSDTDFGYGRTLSQTVGTTLLRLSEATVLPLEFTDVASTVKGYVDEIEKEHQKVKQAPALDLSPVRSALARLENAAAAYETAFAGLSAASSSSLLSRRLELAALNRILYSTERALGQEGGLPRRDWFKHQVYAPGLLTGYGVKTLPAIREAVEQKYWEEAGRSVGVVARIIENLATEVERAKSELEKLLSSGPTQ
jgi:N-acetylated-alpha-linked acidic dipeptidase